MTADELIAWLRSRRDQPGAGIVSDIIDFDIRAIERTNGSRSNEMTEAERLRLQRENEELRYRLKRLESNVGRITAEPSIDERNELAAAQVRADSVARYFGETASAPVTGENSIAYRKRLLAKYIARSPRFKGVTLRGADDSATLGVFEGLVYADATNNACGDAARTPGALIPIRERDSAGREITRFVGDIGAWMAPFMTPGIVGHFIRPTGTAAKESL